MSLEMDKPKYRCQKCETPLRNEGLRERSGKEITAMWKAERGPQTKWQQLWYGTSPSLHFVFENVIDHTKRNWSCPNCHETYTETIEGDNRSERELAHERADDRVDDAGDRG